MSEKLIKQAWLAEFGDDSHVSLHCYTLAYNAGHAAGETSGAEEEQKRWCEELDFLHTEYGADSSGCDSGDPLDCVEVEIRQAITSARKQVAKEILMVCLHGLPEDEYWSDDKFEQWVREKYDLEI